MDIRDIFLQAEELSILEQFFRTTILYFALFFANKALGYRQPGIVTPYNFLIAAGISHIAASRMMIPDSSLVDAIAIITIYTGVMLFVSYGYFKFPSFVSQTPEILVKDGNIIRKSLKKTKLTIDNLFSILREKGAFNLGQVDVMVAEATGDYSVAVNSNVLPVTKSRMGIKAAPTVLSQLLIYKGEVDENVLKRNQLDMVWVLQQLKKYGLSNAKGVYVGIITPEKDLYINQ